MPPRRHPRGLCCGGRWGGFFILLALAMSLYILGPPVYWHLASGGGFSIFKPYNCPPCPCDCIDDLAAISSPLSRLGNMSLADCLKDDVEVAADEDTKEITKLSEELKLQQTVSEENQQKSELAFLEIKRVASQYQKEAEKCNIGMETSEDARETADEALAAGRRLTALWERRARSMGWKDNKEGPFRIPVDDPLESGTARRRKNLKTLR